jgi:hypothetical protein
MRGAYHVKATLRVKLGEAVVSVRKILGGSEGSETLDVAVHGCGKQDGISHRRGYVEDCTSRSSG